jgi:hypothetical protein
MMQTILQLQTPMKSLTAPRSSRRIQPIRLRTKPFQQRISQPPMPWLSPFSQLPTRRWLLF